MFENGTEQRRCALDDEHAGIDAFCEAENTVLAAEDAHKEATATRSAALGALLEAKEDLLKPEIPLDDALERVRVTAQRFREAKLAVTGEDGTLACLNKATDARDEAFDEMIKRKDHLRGLLDDYDEKREAKAEEDKAKPVNPVVETNDVLNREATKAEAASEELHDTDMHVSDVLLDVLGDKSREMMPPERLIAEMRTVVDAKRAKYPDIKTFRIVEWPSLRESLIRLDRLGYWVVELSERLVKFWLGPQLIVEPEPGFPEEGKCLNDVGNPDCRIHTNKDKHGEYYTRCWSCNKIFQERRDAKPVKAEPEPDDSGTLFEKPEPEPEPVPVPASTAMLEAKPEADDLAELIGARFQYTTALDRIGHWHSKRFTVALAAQLYDDGATHADVALLRGIMTVLEGLGVDSAYISNGVLTSTSGVKVPSHTANKLIERGVIKREKRHPLTSGYELTSGFAGRLEGDTSAHSTKFTVDVSARLAADGVSLAARNVLWACMAVHEGASGDTVRIPTERIAPIVGIGSSRTQYHTLALKDLEYVEYHRGMVYGWGPRLTNE